ETANSLARDLQRYLADEPVEACPPSTAYRLRKFVRRHKTAVAIAIGALIFILVATVGIAWQAVAARRAAQEALAAAAAEAVERRQAVAVAELLESVFEN